MEKVTAMYLHKDGPIIDNNLIYSTNRLIGAGGRVLTRIKQELGEGWEQSNLIYRAGDNNRTCVLGYWSFSGPTFPSYPYDYYFFHYADISKTINRWVRNGEYFEANVALIDYTPQDSFDLLSDKLPVSDLSGEWGTLSDDQQQLILTEKRRYSLPGQSLTIEGSIVNYDRLRFSLSFPLTIIDGINSDLLLDQIMVWVKHLPFKRNSSDPKSKDSLLLRQFSKKDQIELVAYILNGLAEAREIQFLN